MHESKSRTLARWLLSFGSTALAALLLVVGFSCSGGGAESRATQPGCEQEDGSEGLCLVSCNLGCSLLGCAVTDIAQNQPLIMVFNQDIDSGTLNTSSFSLRTASGQEPVGEYLVSGSTITFIPEVRVIGGASFFGFEANETYVLKLPAGQDEINALRSINGDPLSDTITCNLKVSRGVVDLDGEAPTAALASPTTSLGVDPQTLIVLEFSEIIDITPFLQATSGNEPLQVLVNRTQQLGGGALACDPKSTPAKVRGSWTISNDIVRQVSTASFKTSQVIPRGVCVTVDVTTSVRDLAGTPSPGQTFQYFTLGGPQPEETLVEDFTTDDFFDETTSAIPTWVGGAVPGLLGGDGRHGEFEASVGRLVSPGIYEWSTDSQVIPKNRTRSGEDEEVTDGVFYFSNFVLPPNVFVRFVGRNPARLFVRGVMQVDGTIELNGASQAEHDGLLVSGQPGGIGASGGGDGGAGADAGDGVKNRPNFNGQHGDDLRLPASRAYGSSSSGGSSGGGHGRSPSPLGSSVSRAGEGIGIVVPNGTGGRGSHQFPSSGSDVDVVPALQIFSLQVAAGGSGGGFMTAGAMGRVIGTPSEQPEFGPPSIGGAAFSFPPLPSGTGVMDHYLVGGSGGGGAGSHPFFHNLFQKVWRSGSGGAGGGGALGARVGRNLIMGTAGSLRAVGGSTFGSATNNFASPGGGGSGGSLILQMGEVPVQRGVLDVSGGVGGTTTGGFVAMSTKGGDGSPGYVRIEVPGAVPSDPTVWTGPTLPVATAFNVASLTESDAITGVQSDWYRTGSLFPPDYVRYVLEAKVDGDDRTFSDDPGIVGAELASGGPVSLWVQGASEDLAFQVDPTTVTQWRRYVGAHASGTERALTDDGGTVFRFLLLFDKSLADEITVTKLSMVFKPL